MAGREDETQQVVANVIVESRFKIGYGHLFCLELATEFFVLALMPRVSAEVVNGAMLGGGHEPGARVVRDARLRPLLERGDESILCQVLGQSDVAYDPRQTGNEPRRLDPPDRVDCAMCIGSHCYPSHHLQFLRASPDAPCHEACF